MYIKLAWRNLWRNKRRTLITVASIFFGVFLSCVMNGIKEGTFNRMIDNTVGSYLGFVQVQAPDYWDEKILDNGFTVRQSLLDSIASVNNVDFVVPRIEYGIMAIGAQNQMKLSMIVGVDPEIEHRFSKLKDRMREGEYLNKDDREVIIAEGLAKYLNLKVGGEIALYGFGYHGTSATELYRVKGIFKMGDPRLNKRLIYIPIKEAQYLFGMPDVITNVVVKINKANNSDVVDKKLTKLLGDNYSVMHWMEMMPEIKGMIEQERAEGNILYGVLYIVIAFGIYGTILMMLSERAHEFGVLIAIGMKRFKLAVIVLLETIIMAFLGAVAGSVFSFPILLMMYFNPIPMELDPELIKVYEDFGFEPVIQTSIDSWIFIQQGIVVCTIACLLGIYPFFKLLKMRAIDEMRS